MASYLSSHCSIVGSNVEVGEGSRAPSNVVRRRKGAATASSESPGVGVGGGARVFHGGDGPRSSKRPRQQQQQQYRRTVANMIVGTMVALVLLASVVLFGAVRAASSSSSSSSRGNLRPVVASSSSVGVAASDDGVARARRDAVRGAVRHAWRGYRAHAWGRDSLRPLSGTGDDEWGGVGATLLDALDTLWIVGLREEFAEARDRVASSDLDFSRVRVPVSVFETTIRCLGGLLAAYEVSRDPVFVERANDLGRRLLPAFTDSPSGLPYGRARLADGPDGGGGGGGSSWFGGRAVLAEVGTLQMEFRLLSRLTGRREYADAAERVYDVLYRAPTVLQGLYPVYVDHETSPPVFPKDNNRVTFGALGDSFYEYLLKVWLQGGRRETKYRKMYDDAVDALHKHLILTTTTGLTYVAELLLKSKGKATLLPKMEHLACFLPGTLALGAYTHPNGIDSPTAQRDLQTAKKLVETCYRMYTFTKTGLAPEAVAFRAPGDENGSNDMSVAPGAAHNLLRPETVESLYVLYQVTGDEVYREWGWTIFESFERRCRTPAGYASLSDVNDLGPDALEDRMESFFLAETLKYLYLLQDPDNESGVDVLHTHIMNTEAHPFRTLDAYGKKPVI